LQLGEDKPLDVVDVSNLPVFGPHQEGDIFNAAFESCDFASPLANAVPMSSTTSFLVYQTNVAFRQRKR
jgi:hypothetical protein